MPGSGCDATGRCACWRETLCFLGSGSAGASHQACGLMLVAGNPCKQLASTLSLTGVLVGEAGPKGGSGSFQATAGLGLVQLACDTCKGWDSAWQLAPRAAVNLQASHGEFLGLC